MDMRSDKAAVVKELTTTLSSIEQVTDPEYLQQRVRELEDKAADPPLGRSHSCPEDHFGAIYQPGEIA